MKSNIVETVTGGVVILVAAAFFVFAYQVTGVNSATGGYQVRATFNKATGLARGADVVMAGVKIGSVVDKSLDPETFEAVVTMSIDPTVRPARDSVAAIALEGLLGGHFVELKPGGSEETLRDGDMIELTQEPIDLNELIGIMAFGDKEECPKS